MNRYLSVALAAAALLPATAMAQNEVDALRYSQVSSAATARSLGLGGAGGSYGGDFSSLSINPAGIGIYRNSEIMFTPTLRINSMNGSYLGSNSSDNNAKFNLGNFGAVFTTASTGKNYQNSAWKAFSIGVGYNRVADFNSHGNYQGNNTLSSMTEGFAADAKYSTSPYTVPPYGYLGFQSFLTDTAGNSIPYENIIKKNGSLNQAKAWESTGGINEWTLSLGGNYMEKLMLGATLGITSYKYGRTTTYYEEDASLNPNNYFDNMTYDEYLSTTGIGVNFKLGAIYKVNDYFRIGGSFHSPTWSSFTDLSEYDMTTNTEGFKASLNPANADPVTAVQPYDQDGNPITYQYDYSLRTPWRGILSATAFMGKYGFITADYEYAAYNTMKYNFANADAAYERQVNDAIKDTYKGTHNFRIGVEGKLENYMARIGFAYYSSPYKQSDLFDGQRMDLSAGLGARFGKFFIDLAYVHIMQKNAEFAYPVITASNDALNIRQTPVDLANLKYSNNMIAMTLGVKF